MKKCILMILCALILTGCAATYDGPTTVEPRLTEYTLDQYYVFLNGDVDHDIKRTVYAYDIHGNRVREMDYSDDRLFSVTKMRFDDRGNMIESTTWDHSGWLPKFSCRVTKTFDEQDRLLTQDYYDFWGRKTGSSTYTYDDEERTRTWSSDDGDSQITWYDENGNELRQVAGEYETVYEYDDRGNMTGWQSFEQGQPTDSYRARYDDRDRIIWGGRYDPAGELESETTYTYDDALGTKSYDTYDGGRTVEHYHADGRLHMIEDFDAAGRLVFLHRYYYQDIQVPVKEGTS